MNLKDAFRYQNYINGLIDKTRLEITNQEHAFRVTKVHKKSAAGVGIDDVVEEPAEPEWFSNDDMIRFMCIVISEKEKLSYAISAAKRAFFDRTGVDIDASLEVNKHRRNMATSVETLLRYKPSLRTRTAQGYTFNAEGNQVPYIYEMEVKSEDAFNRDMAKATYKALIEHSDKASDAVDSAMVNEEVNFSPIFCVTDSFDDCVDKFVVNP